MRLRWKLMLLLLAIAIIPVSIAALIARTSNKKMSTEMTADISQVLLANAYQHLQQLTDRATATLDRDRSIIETAVDVQVLALQRLMMGDPLRPGRVYFDEEFDDPSLWPPGTAPSPEHVRYDENREPVQMPVSYDTMGIRLLPGATAPAVADDIARLASLKDTFAFLKRRHPSLILWQYAAAASGVHATYPGHGGFPQTFDSRERVWYSLAAQRKEGVWAPPIIDASTQQMLLTRVRPILDETGEVVAVTGIDVSMTRILQNIDLPEAWRDHAKVAMCVLPPEGQEGSGELRVVAQQDYTKLGQDWDMQVEMEVLDSADRGEFEALLDDVRAAHSSVRRMAFQENDALWACGPLQTRRNNTMGGAAFALIIIIPYQDMMAVLDSTQVSMKTRFDRQLQFTGLLMIIIVSIVVVLAFLSARAVSHPIRKLAAAATSVAMGDLQAKAEVKSKDEIGELAQAFNVMVPKLQDRIRLKESLELAMDVQQHLLPGDSPEVEGLDITGRSVYCDETGGDYYDFLQLHEFGSKRLGVVIGDVTGHGIAAAMLMATARALLHIRAPQSGDVAEVITDMNRHLSNDTPAGKFMTFYYFLLDMKTRSARWVSAGHDPAIVYDPATDAFEDLVGLDVPLGVDPGWTFKESSPEGFTTGQVIMLGTDGIWEARNAEGDMFGKDRLKDVIKASAGKSSEAIADDIIASIVAFRDGHPQEDDITLIVMKFVEN